MKTVKEEAECFFYSTSILKTTHLKQNESYFRISRTCANAAILYMLERFWMVLLFLFDARLLQCIPHKRKLLRSYVQSFEEGWNSASALSP